MEIKRNKMLGSYHQIFRLDSLTDKELSLFSRHYNHVYHRAYVLVTQQNISNFKAYFNFQYPKKSIKELVQLYLNNKIKLPHFEFDLNSENKKLLSSKMEITGRQLNSIRFQLKGNLSSLYELLINNIESKKEKLISLNEKLNKLNDKINYHYHVFKINSIENKPHKVIVNKIKSLLFAYHQFVIQNHKSKRYHKYTKKEFKFKDFANNKGLNVNHVEILLPLYYKQQHLISNIKKLNHELNNNIKNLLEGKLSLCFGTKKLFNKQFNLKHYYKDYNSDNHTVYFKKWKQEFTQVRNHSFYLTGAVAETSGNQSCQAKILSNGNVSLYLRHMDKFLSDDAKQPDKYIVLRNLNFGKYHDKLIQALNKNQYVHYRFEKNINHKSPKYGSWVITFQVDNIELPIITDKLNGVLGIDLNQNHISLAHTNKQGNLLNAWDIDLKLNRYQSNYFNNKHNNIKNNSKRINKNVHYNKITTLSSNQSEYLLGRLMIEVCNKAKELKTPIVIEKLDFKYKKFKQFNDDNSYHNYGLNSLRKKRNKQLSAFAYRKFAELLKSRCFKDGIELIEVNPAYTSLLAKAKYQKDKGISTHQAAAFCIARRGFGFKERIQSIPFNVNQEISHLFNLKIKELKSYNKKHKIKLSDDELKIKNRQLKEEVYREFEVKYSRSFIKSFILKGCVVNYLLPVRNKDNKKTEAILYKALSSEIKEVSNILNLKLKGVGSLNNNTNISIINSGLSQDVSLTYK